MAETIYITVEEIAELLRVSRMTIYRLVNDGTIPSTRIGRSIRIRRTDFNAYLNRNEENE
jgi:excisionase family DNA binding protein